MSMDLVDSTSQPLFSPHVQTPYFCFKSSTSTPILTPTSRHTRKKRSSGSNIKKEANSFPVQQPGAIRFQFQKNNNEDVKMYESGWQQLSSLQTEAMMQIVCGRILKSHPQTVQAVRCTCKAWKQAVQSFGRIRVIRIDSQKEFNIGKNYSQALPQNVYQNQNELEFQEQKIDALEIPDVPNSVNYDDKPEPQNPAAEEFARIIREAGESENGTLISLVYLYLSDFIDLKKQDIQFGGPVKIISQHASLMTPFSQCTTGNTKNSTVKEWRCGGRKYTQIRMPNQVLVKQHQVEFEQIRVSFSNTTTFSTKEEPNDFNFQATEGGKILMTDAQFASKNGFITSSQDGYVNLTRTEFVTTVVLKACQGGRIDIGDCRGDLFMIANNKGSFINIVNCHLDVLEVPVGQTLHLARAQGGSIVIKDSVVHITVKRYGPLPSNIRPFDTGVEDSWIVFSCAGEGTVSLDNVTFKFHDIFCDECLPDITVKNMLFIDGSFTLQDILADVHNQQSI